MNFDSRHRMSTSRLRAALAALCVLWLSGGVNAQDRIALRGAVRVDAQCLKVRLADVAELSGPIAEALGDRIIFEAAMTPAGPVTVHLDGIRQALEKDGANLGLLALSGRDCVIRWRHASPATDRPAPDEPAAAPSDAPTFASEYVDEPTIRGLVARFLAGSLLRRNPKDVQVAFRAQDAEELSAGVAGFDYEIRPQASRLSPTIPLLINVFRGPSLVRTVRITVDVQVRQRVLVVQSYVARGVVLTPADLVEDVRLTSPHLTSLPHRSDQVVGLETDRRLVPGQILEDSDTVGRTVVFRNSEFEARARYGMFIMRMRVRALNDARAGETVRVQRLVDRVEFVGNVGPDGSVTIDTGSDDSLEASP